MLYLIIVDQTILYAATSGYSTQI